MNGTRTQQNQFSNTSNHHLIKAWLIRFKNPVFIDMEDLYSI
jgi:hypothetical protein